MTKPIFLGTLFFIGMFIVALALSSVMRNYKEKSAKPPVIQREPPAQPKPKEDSDSAQPPDNKAPNKEVVAKTVVQTPSPTDATEPALPSLDGSDADTSPRKVQDKAPLKPGYRRTPTYRSGLSVPLLVYAKDEDNDPLLYEWIQLSGPSARIENPRQAKTVFVPTGPGDYVFEIRVSDGKFTSRDELRFTVPEPMQ